MTDSTDTNNTQNDKGKTDNADKVTILPAATVALLGYSLPRAPDSESVNNYLCFLRHDAEKVARRALAHWGPDSQAIEGYLKRSTLSNAELGDILAVILIVPVLVGENNAGRFLQTPNPILENRTPWDVLCEGPTSSRRVRDRLLAQVMQ